MCFNFYINLFNHRPHHFHYPFQSSCLFFSPFFILFYPSWPSLSLLPFSHPLLFFCRTHLPSPTLSPPFLTPSYPFLTPQESMRELLLKFTKTKDRNNFSSHSPGTTASLLSYSSLLSYLTYLVFPLLPFYLFFTFLTSNLSFSNIIFIISFLSNIIYIPHSPTHSPPHSPPPSLDLRNVQRSLRERELSINSL